MRHHLLALAASLILTGSAAAQPSGVQGAPGWAGGTIVKTDTASRTITVKQGSDEQAYVLAADAKVLAGKKAVPAADLASAIGQRVTIRYEVTDGTRTASRVTLLGAAPVTGTATKTAPAAASPTPQP